MSESTSSQTRIEDIYPVTPLQDGMLYEQERDPRSGAYWNSVEYIVNGSFKPDVFRAAWQMEVDRQTILRTRFIRDKRGRALQVVEREAELSWLIQDLRGSNASEIDKRLLAYQDGQDTSGRLDQLPLMSVAVFRTGVSEYRVVWRYHHILLDAWSEELLWSGVLERYRKLVDGLPLLESPPELFSKYVAWVGRRDLTLVRTYWADYFESYQHEVMSAPPVPPVFAERSVCLTAETCDRASAFAREHGITLNTLLQGVWALVLSAETGRADVVMGTAVADRPASLSGASEMVGLLLATLPARYRTDSSQPLQEWLAESQRRLLSSIEQGGLSLAEIKQIAGIEPETVFFDWLYGFNTMSAPVVSVEDGVHFDERRRLGRTGYPFSVVIVASATIEVRVSFDESRYSPERCRRILSRFEYLLDLAMAMPEKPVRDLNWLTDAEVDSLNARDRGSAAPIEHLLPLDQWLASVARSKPENIAIEFGSEVLTYRQLRQRSNLLAGYLMSKGVRTGEPVGVFLERSLLLVPTILAIWQLGAVYVPFDPSAPLQRVRSSARQIGVEKFATSGELAGRLEFAGRVIPVDAAEFLNTADGSDSSVPVSTSSMSGTAYVIFTSGSTGTPNAVPIRHDSLVNMLESFRVLLDLGADDRLLAITTVAFDISLFELFGLLVAGGTVCLAPSGTGRDPRQLSDALDERRITAQFATPGTWESLLAIGWEGRERMRAFVGGDALRSDLAGALLDRVEALWNLYGPTETTIASTATPVRKGPPVDVGKPIPNTLLRVVDSQLRLLPDDVPGELCIGGLGLSEGYLNNPDRTNERFVQLDTVAAEERFFRTGDLATTDGEDRVHLLGRVGSEINMRGFRIDPGEIESALNGLHGVRGCCVTLRRLAAGPPALVAYLVPADDSAILEPQQIRDQLLRVLPPYMIPAFYVKLSELPHNANGKLDRAALPDPPPPSPSGTGRQLSEDEKTIAKCWEELLGIAPSEPADDFVALGGHSLLAAKLSSVLSAKFDVLISVSDLLMNPSLSGQAQLLGRSFGDVRRVVIEPARDRSVFPLSSIQSRLWYLEHIEPGVNNVTSAYHVRGDLDVSKLRSALERLAHRHEVLRTVFVSEQGEPRQCVLDKSDVDWDEETFKTDAECDSRLEQLSRHPFVLAERPPWMVRLLRSPAGETLVLNFHHIVVDGESIPVVLSELSRTYLGQDVDFPETLQYGDFCLWQRDQEAQSTYLDSLEVWRSALSGELPVLQFPSFSTRPAVQTFSGGFHRATLDEEAYAAIRTSAGSCGVTPFNLLLCGYVATLLRFCRQSEVVVGVPVGLVRELVGAGEAVGPYLNTIALRLAAEPNMSVAALLGAVSRQSLAGLQHSHVPFEDIVAALEVPRDASRTPVFQTLFAYRSSSGDKWGIPGLDFTPMDIGARSSRTDLSCWINEVGGTLQIEIEFASELFDESVIRAFLQSYITYLEAGFSDTERCWTHVPWLAQSVQQYLPEGSLGPVIEVNEITVGEFIWQAAAEHPESLAVSSASGRLTYEELRSRVAAFAASLGAAGVVPGETVGLSVSRNHLLPVAVLGVLEAGAAYVPIDAGFPAERLSFMLADAGMRVVVTDDPMLESLPGFDGQLLHLTNGVLAGTGEANRASARPDCTAYLIYTSGSTGKPKGVAVGHRQVVNLLTVLREPLGMETEDVLAAVTTLSFDISVLELLLPLSVGGRVHVVDEATARDGSALARELVRSEASILQATPATWRMLLDAGWRGAENLRALCGGEPLPLDLARKLADCCDTVWNMYGPTETTVWSTMWRVDPDSALVSIGRPMGNTNVYVVDDQLTPVPAGVTGEILVSGLGVAEGYHGDEQRTAERFLADPFSDFSRMYRTGDLGRWRPDGSLEHLGRNDSQLKVRGFRIEAGDIENHLISIAAVADAAVAVRRGTEGDDRLVAFVVPQAGENLNPLDLRRHLRERVPVFMLPQHFVMLDALPLTPNRKVDRARLPELQQLFSPPIRGQTADSLSKAEARIARIWSELLGTENLSAGDSFFDVGGHSLLSLRAIVRLREETGVEFAPQDFFTMTLGDMAERLEHEGPLATAEPVRWNVIERLKNAFKSRFGD